MILINSQLKTIIFMSSDKKNEIKLRKILTLEILTVVRSSHQRYSATKGVFRNFAKFTGHLCQSLFFNKVAGLSPVSTKAVFGRFSSKQVSDLQLYLEETPTQVLSYEIYEIFKNTFFDRTTLLCWLLLAANCVNE